MSIMDIDITGLDGTYSNAVNVQPMEIPSIQEMLSIVESIKPPEDTMFSDLSPGEMEAMLQTIQKEGLQGVFVSRAGYAYSHIKEGDRNDIVRLKLPKPGMIIGLPAPAR